MSSTTRDRILDALEGVLIEQGPSAATLESVADAAGVSKGGLLYHFPTKGAMTTGLVRRLAARAEEEFAAARRSPEGVARFFLRTSLPGTAEEAELYWSVIAALRSKEGVPAEAAELIGRMFEQWSRLLHEELGDPVLAETIRLVGDGLYLSAIAGLPQPDPRLLERVLEHLTARADAARSVGGDGAAPADSVD
ncbi:TetR/AcrR family transcriptional regulator [Streptomonospora salina]|uniref:AcrR family transcriptional regulator n=1 Tax=Streptomonospora salina TaxID=104205 RepID=A0A841EHE3_9ACTN|nr:TetR/AcrR family transcriptional regulator [Streptomonospora salina]MBB6000789.1 AcrR family transcriptional regulator [Streptomonospora salina]